MTNPSVSPVETPQLRRHALFGGTAGSTFTRWAMSTTVNSLKLDTYRKWYSVSPLRSVNLLVSSLCIQGETLNGKFEHWLLFLDLQSAHAPQSAMKLAMTISPSVTSSTSSPMLSTTLQGCNHERFITLGNLKKKSCMAIEIKLHLNYFLDHETRRCGVDEN